MSLKDRKAVVTGGPTREWLDPVRFISNPSSGKMGIALAEAMSRRARETVFIHGPINDELLKNREFRVREVITTVDLLNAVMEEIGESAILIMAAAPADYRPAEKAATKIKKKEEELLLRLVRNPDILAAVSEKRSRGELKDIIAVGFAAETTDARKHAIEKLKRKNLDMICLNDVTACGAGFGTDSNVITIFTRYGKSIELPIMSKEDAAERIVDEIEKIAT